MRATPCRALELRFCREDTGSKSDSWGHPSDALATNTTVIERRYASIKLSPISSRNTPRKQIQRFVRRKDQRKYRGECFISKAPIPPTCWNAAAYDMFADLPTIFSWIGLGLDSRVSRASPNQLPARSLGMTQQV